MTLEEAFRQYLIYISIQFPKSEKTIAGYRNDLSRYFQFLAQKEIDRIDQIDSAMLEEYVRVLARDHAAASVNHAITAIRGFHQFLAFRFDEPDPAEYLDYACYWSSGEGAKRKCGELKALGIQPCTGSNTKEADFYEAASYGCGMFTENDPKSALAWREFL